MPLEVKSTSLVTAWEDRQVETAINLEELELFSLVIILLRPQVAGFAGSNLQNPKVARITGLDTAGIGFNCLLDNNDCLDASDADFVDEIHTLVSALSKGHADFYPIPKGEKETV